MFMVHGSRTRLMTFQQPEVPSTVRAGALLNASTETLPSLHFSISDSLMTEYHTTNGSSKTHAHYSEPSEAERDSRSQLEESVASLLSTDSLVFPDENKTAKSLYRKCAKLFINKRFEEAYTQSKQLAEVSVNLVEKGKLDGELFVKIWYLYLNIIDKVLNDEHPETIPQRQRDSLEKDLLSDRFFATLYSLSFIVDPQLISLLTLIKLNNDKSDLASLRQQVELYIVQASSTFNKSDSEWQHYLELLEVYHVYLLVKLGQTEESEFLIRSNPHIEDPEAMLVKMKNYVKELRDLKKQKEEFQRKKELAAQRKRDQRSSEKAKENLYRELQKSKEASVSEQKKNTAIESKDITQASEISVLDVLKKRLQMLNNRSVLTVILSLVSLLALAQTKGLFLNGRVRGYLRSFWQKLGSTLQMALRVTYV